MCNRINSPMGMATVFERAVNFVLRQEGGETTDTGGHTKYGISSKAHPDIDLSTLTIAGAKEIYRNRYWAPIRYIQWPVTLALLDASVNMGQLAAVALMQKAINDLLGRPALKEDGLLGPATNRALTTFRPPLLACQLAARTTENRIAWYCRLASQDKYKPYLRGWVLRCARLLDEIAQEWARFSNDVDKT